MKKIYSVLFAMMMVATINAQPPKGMGQSDPAAKKVLDANTNAIMKIIFLLMILKLFF